MFAKHIVISKKKKEEILCLSAEYQKTPTYIKTDPLWCVSLFFPFSLWVSRHENRK